MAPLMPCYHPLKAFQTTSGDVIFAERGQIARVLELPCGRCVGCRLERSRQWAVRISHEASLWDRNCFITLTYDVDHIPAGGSLVYRDFQLFMKRLRREAKQGVRFYMCGEYGEGFDRPHFHACLFNFDFADKVLWRKGRPGADIYRSAVLERLWPFGFSTVGSVTFESAAYCARYVMKKVTGDLAVGHYRCVDTETGEVIERVPEFNHMSLKPGIGAEWFEKYSRDVFPHDFVIVKGKRCKPPRYYDKILKRRDALGFDDVNQDRMEWDPARDADNTVERLREREIVEEARISFLKREIT
nr:replication associated protein [Flumine microvirus 26]